MKETIVRLLNGERIEARIALELAKKNHDLVSLLAYKKLIDLIGRLIKTIQDEA
jgi:hypothetical protein